MDLTERLTLFYKQYCPEKLDDINMIIDKYCMHEKDLFKKLTQKYGPEPEQGVNRRKEFVKMEDSKKKYSKEKDKEKNNTYDYMEKLLGSKEYDLLSKLDALEGKPITKELLAMI